MSLHPLAGVHVVDATSGIAGPLCGKLLADAGATVTGVDFAGNDNHTESAGDDGWARFLGRDKHPFSLDPADHQDRDVLEQLLARASLYLCSSCHEELQPHGLDCPSVLERHPALLTACLTPFGQKGPYASYASDDLVLSALSGLADCTPGFPDRQEHEGEPPIQSLAPLAEVGAGVVAAVSLLSALLQRLRGAERPRHVELSAHEANVWLMVSEWGIASYGGSAPGRTRKSRSLEPNCYLQCRDGYVVVVATTDKHWQALTEAMGDPAWASDPRFADVEGRAAHAPDLHANLRNWAATASGREFMEAAQARGVPCTCYLDLTETLESDQVRAMGSVETVAGERFPADPIIFNGTRRTPPLAVAPRPTTFPAASDTRNAPLSGVRVLDLGQMVAGPMAGQTLAALGAEVVIVESSSRLPSRQFGPFAGRPTYDASSNFNHCNRGKESVTIDLLTEEGRRVLRELVKVSDVVLENFSRKAASRLDLEYTDLVRDREHVILASISAFGRSGPWGDYVSHHGGVTALSGLASVIRDEHGNPRLVGGIYPDVLTGTYTALAVIQAIAQRERTGLGCHIEVSMLDVMLNCMGGLVADSGQEAHREPHPGRFLATAENGRFLAVAAEDCDRNPALTDEVRGLSRRDAMAALQASGVRAAAVLDMLEIMSDPHLLARGFVQEYDHAVAGRKPLQSVPWRWDGERPPLGVAPLLGEHTENVLTGVAGLARTRVRELQTLGALK